MRLDRLSRPDLAATEIFEWIVLHVTLNYNGSGSNWSTENCRDPAGIIVNDHCL